MCTQFLDKFNSPDTIKRNCQNWANQIDVLDRCSKIRVHTRSAIRESLEKEGFMSKERNGDWKLVSPWCLSVAQQ